MAAVGAVNTLAAFGRFQATVGLVFAVCIAMSCCGSGVVGLKNPDPKEKSKSFLFFIGAILVLLLGYLIYSFAQTSRTGAAVMGGVGAVDIMGNILRN
jgi:hypothetical protein